MRFARHPRLVWVPVAAALAAGLFAVSLTWQVPTARAGGGLDGQANELVRLINGARAAEGRGALVVDPFLASKARDGVIPCPDDPAKTINGRALDFASYGTMSHYLRLCDAPAYTLSGTTFVSVLQNAWAYWTVGEIDLVNGGYGNGAFLYTIGSWQTWTYSTTGNAMLGWKSSSSHWNIIVGSYDRVGCGGWASGSTYYYDCLFSSGGPSPSGLVQPPTASPFSNPLPTTAPPPPVEPTQAPVAVAPPVTAAPVAPAPVAPAGGASAPTAPPAAPSIEATVPPSSGPAASETSAPLELVAPVPTATPARLAAALIVDGGPGIASSGASGLPGTVVRVVAVVAGSGAVLLYVGSTLLSVRRRRRRNRSQVTS